jgi:hypothetical protein
VQSGSTMIRPARSVCAPVAVVSVLANGDACTPAAHTLVLASMRSSPSAFVTVILAVSIAVAASNFDTHPLEGPRGVLLKSFVEGPKDGRACLDERGRHLVGIHNDVLTCWPEEAGYFKRSLMAPR